MQARKWITALTAVTLTVSLTACSRTADTETLYQSGTYTGQAQGFGGTVTVTVETDNSSIQSVTVEGPEESPDYGGAYLEKLGQQILAAQSADIDGISGATVTSNAVIEAAGAAIALAKGESAAAATGTVQMAPGTYEAEATGFFLGVTDKIQVTVDEISITDIQWNPDEESGDTPSMLACVEEQLFPRILEYQSYAVDGVTGATATSSAVKLAVRSALLQALEAGGSDTSALAAFAGVPEKAGGEQTISTDLLVVGMGGSGTYTALRAAEQGVQVLIIEQEGRYGGTTALTSEIAAINPPRIAAQYNSGADYVDAAALESAWQTYVGNEEKSELLDLFFEQSGPALDWLALDHGIAFDFTPSQGLLSSDGYAICFRWSPDSAEGVEGVYGANTSEIMADFDTLVNAYEDAGGTYMLETTAYELIMGEDGSVQGVRARDNIDGTEYTINAKAVVLATGGFLGSSEMTTQYLSSETYPLAGQWNMYGSRGNTGLMLAQAIANGAATYSIGMPPEVHMAGSSSFIAPGAGFEIHAEEGVLGSFTGVQQVWSAADLPMYLGISPNSLAVGADGLRFADESELASSGGWQAGPYYYSIWSADQLDSIRDQGLVYDLSGTESALLGYCGAIPVGTALPETYEVLQTGIEQGFVFQADTIEELAAAIGVEAKTLTATIEEYNAACDRGSDTSFGKDAQYLEPLGEGPYYAIRMTPYASNTTGGLDVNAEFQVLDADGQPIAGLYAVGLDCSGVLYSEKKPAVTYGGISNGWALTSGYVCGITVADYINGTSTAAEVLQSQVLADAE